MHRRRYFDELPDAYLERGVYQMRGFGVRDGVDRPILAIVFSTGRMIFRVVPLAWTLDGAWDALERWLDRKDPVARMWLVRDPRPAQVPMVTRCEVRALAAVFAPTKQAEDPYENVPRPRRAAPARRRRPQTDRPKKPGDWSWDTIFATPHRLGRGVPRER